MTQPNRSNLRIVTHFEMSTCCGVILSVAVLQAERRIFRLPALCYLRSLGPLVKTRPFGMTRRMDMNFKLRAYRLAIR